MPDLGIKLGFDTSGARVDAEDYGRAVDTIRRYTRQAANDVTDFEGSLKRVSGTAKQTGEAAASGFEKTSRSIEGIAGSFRGAIGNVEGFATNFVENMLKSTTNANLLAESLDFGPEAAKGLGLIGVGAAALAVTLGAAANEALGLERQLLTVTAKTGPENAQKYKEAVLALTQFTGASQDAAAAAIAKAVDLGFGNFEQQFQEAERALQVARTTGASAQGVLLTTDRILNVYSLSVDHAAEVTDKLIAGADRAHKPFEDFSQAAYVAGASLGPLGVDLDQVVKILEKTAPAYASASQAGAILGGTIYRLLSPMDPLHQKLTDLGVDLSATSVKTEGLSGKFAEIKDLIGDDDQVILQLFGSIKQGKLVLAALADDADNLAGSAGAAAPAVQMLKDKVKNLEDVDAEKFDKFVASVKAGFVELGDVAKQSSISTVARVSDAIDAIVPTTTTDEGILKFLFGGIGPASDRVSEQVKRNAEEIKKQQAEVAAQVKTSAPAESVVPDRRVKRSIEEVQALKIEDEYSRASMEARIKSYEEGYAAYEKFVGEITFASLGPVEQERVKTDKQVAALRELSKGLEKEGYDTSELAVIIQTLNRTRDDAIKKLTGETAYDEHIRKLQVEREEVGKNADQLKIMEVTRELDADATKNQSAVLDEQRKKIIALTAATQEAAAVDRAKKGNEELAFQVSLIGKTAAEQERLTALRKFDVDALKHQSDALDEQRAKYDDLLNRKATTQGEDNGAKQIRELEFQGTLIGQTADEQERLTTLRTLDQQNLGLTSQKLDEQRRIISDTVKLTQVKTAEDAERHNLDDLKFQVDLIGKVSEEQERLTALRDFDTRNLGRHSAALDRERLELAKLITEGQEARKAEALGQSFANTLVNGIEAGARGQKGVLRSVANEIENTLLEAFVTGPLKKQLASFLAGLFKSFGIPGLGAGTGGGGGGYGDYDTARGRVFSDQEIVPFARGGGNFNLPEIIDRPTRFALGGNRTGLAGEAGPEWAIAPLKRAPSGNLGVEVSGGGRRGDTIQNVDNSRTFKVVQNFKEPGDRRSKRQSLDDLNRMARSG